MSDLVITKDKMEVDEEMIEPEEEIEDMEEDDDEEEDSMGTIKRTGHSLKILNYVHRYQASDCGHRLH